MQTVDVIKLNLYSSSSIKEKWSCFEVENHNLSKLFPNYGSQKTEKVERGEKLKIEN